MRSLAHDARCGVKRLKSNQNGFRRDLWQALLNPLVALEALEQRLIARKVAPRTAGCEATIQFSWSLEAQLTGERFHQAVLSPYVRGGLVQLLPLCLGDGTSVAAAVKSPMPGQVATVRCHRRHVLGDLRCGCLRCHWLAAGFSPSLLVAGLSPPRWECGACAPSSRCAGALRCLAFWGGGADSLPLLRVLMQEPFCVVKSCVRCPN